VDEKAFDKVLDDLISENLKNQTKIFRQFLDDNINKGNLFRTNPFFIMKLLKADFSKYLKNEEIIQKIKEMKIDFELFSKTRIDLIDYCFYFWMENINYN